MQYTGKKTRRLRLPSQLCVDEAMAIEIHRRAEQGYRKQEDQIRLLIVLGMLREDEILGKELTLPFPHKE